VRPNVASCDLDGEAVVVLEELVPVVSATKPAKTPM
jgi:hypothetical protein